MDLIKSVSHNGLNDHNTSGKVTFKTQHNYNNYNYFVTAV